MPTSSKALREIQRIVHRATDPLYTPIDAFSTALHDARFNSNVKKIDGQQSLGEKIAIYHMFQPHGLLESSFATIRHLSEKGYSVVVSSNADLSLSDVEQLQSQTALILIRPNFGHDFGGYRDAVKVLTQQDVKYQRLLFLNDSIWFPLSASNNLLEDMEGSTSGLTGPMFEKKDGRSHQGHFESYMISLGVQAAEAAEFSEYWNSYRLTSVRRKVLTKGEKGFSRALLDSGVQSSEFCSRQNFVRKIAESDEEFMFNTLFYAEHDNEALEQRRKSLISNIQAKDFLTAAISHVQSVATKSNIQENFPYATMTLFDLPFLKKRNKPATAAMRRAYWRAVEDQKLPPPDPELHLEMELVDSR